MQNIYITEWFKVLYDATVASSLSREQWDTAKQQEEYLGTLQESQGRSLATPRRTETEFSLHDPKSEWINSPTAKKYVEITKHKGKQKYSSHLQASTSSKH